MPKIKWIGITVKIIDNRFESFNIVYEKKIVDAGKKKAQWDVLVKTKNKKKQKTKKTV